MKYHQIIYLLFASVLSVSVAAQQDFQLSGHLGTYVKGPIVGSTIVKINRIDYILSETTRIHNSQSNQFAIASGNRVGFASKLRQGSLPLLTDLWIIYDY